MSPCTQQPIVERLATAPTVADDVRAGAARALAVDRAIWAAGVDRDRLDAGAEARVARDGLSEATAASSPSFGATAGSPPEIQPTNTDLVTTSPTGVGAV